MNLPTLEINGDLYVTGDIVALDPEGMPYNLLVHGKVVMAGERKGDGSFLDGTLRVQGNVATMEDFIFYEGHGYLRNTGR